MFLCKSAFLYKKTAQSTVFPDARASSSAARRARRARRARSERISSFMLPPSQSIYSPNREHLIKRHSALVSSSEMPLYLSALAA